MCQSIEKFKQDAINEGMIKTLTTLLQNNLGELSKEIIDRMKECNSEQLRNLTINLSYIQKEEDILQLIH